MALPAAPGDRLPGRGPWRPDLQPVAGHGLFVARSGEAWRDLGHRQLRRVRRQAARSNQCRSIERAGVRAGANQRREAQVAHWIRFEHDGRTGFGALEDGTITVHEGDMFEAPKPTGETVPLADVKVLTPCAPSKMICLWNNFHALAARLGVPEPDEPLYFLKSPSAFLAHGETIRRPKSYAGNVVYEGELGIVIACGTSIGVSAMRGAENVIEVSIEGIGTLANTFVQQVPFKYGEGPTAPMRACVVGAGAIGGLMAAKLAGAGHPVTVIDQGAHLAAIRA